MGVLNYSAKHRWCFVYCPPGVQSSFNAFNCRAEVAYHAFATQNRRCTGHRTWTKLPETAGRMCEVGPLVNGCSFFTDPYSRLRHSTGILSLRGQLTMST